MKKTLLLTLALALTSLGAMAMSTSKIRNHARYLTDRMAYELDFTPMQYDDCYEINYDFIRQVSYIMDDVVRGYYDAIDSYYRYLDWRNEDLRYIMTTNQYIRFLSRDYFYRPVYSTGTSWEFRIYTIYSNSSFFYFDAPTVFHDYRGGHSRANYSSGFYHSRYNTVPHYSGNGRIMGSNNFNDHRRNDFGTNLRDRNTRPDYNNYNNRNSNNRTADPRYRDNSGNHNTPLINQRGTASGEHRGATTQDNSRRPTTTPQTQASQGQKENRRSGTATGSRSGNQTPTNGRGTTTTSSRRGN